MKLTSRITTLPGWVYQLEVEDNYIPGSVLKEGINTIDHPDVEYMEAHYLTTSGLIIVNCRLCVRKDTEDLFLIEGSNIMLYSGLSGSIALEVDALLPSHPASVT